MTHISSPKDYPLQVSNDTVLFGLNHIPLGEVKKIFPSNTPRLTLWSEGAFNRKGKIISLHFECQTTEKMRTLVEQLLLHSELNREEFDHSTILPSRELPVHCYTIFPDEILLQSKGNFYQPLPFPSEEALKKLTDQKEVVLESLQQIENEAPELQSAIAELEKLLNLPIDALRFHMMQNIVRFLYEQMNRKFSATES